MSAVLKGEGLARDILGAPTPRAAFVVLLKHGFWPITIYPRGSIKKNGEARQGKEPMGQAWGLERWTLERANAEFHRMKDVCLGLCLGPGRGPAETWLADVEGDGPGAEASRLVLFGGEEIETLGWGSARGGHKLLTVDPERIATLLPRLKSWESKEKNQAGVYKSSLLPGLELRIGGYKPDGTAKQLQSVVPPTPGTDGRPRVWTGPAIVRPAPEAFYRTLEELAPKAPGSSRFAGVAANWKVRAGGESDQDHEARRISNYVMMALADEAAKVAGTPVGERHDAMLKASINMAGLIKGANFPEDVYRRVLAQAANACDLPDGEASDLIESALRVATPRDMSRAKAWKPEADAKAEKNGHHATNGQAKGPPGDGGPKDTDEADGRPTVICGWEAQQEGFKTWTPLAIDALAVANEPNPSVFQRAKKLVRLSLAVDDDEQPTIQNLNSDALRGILDRAAYWGNEEITKKGRLVKYGPPRMDIVKDILSLGSLDPDVFPPLESIAESPVFAADGRLILEPGYHREAKLFYSPSQDLRGIEVPAKPSGSDVSASLSLIFDELLYDFPFHDQASRANALAVMLLPFVRLMIPGPLPNHHFTASTEGVGKGKCANACSFPFLGRDLEVNPQKESEAEWRKALTSFLMSGGSHFFIDNLRNPLGWDDVPQDIESGILCAAWTGGRWRDRILGGNDEAKPKLNVVFMSSGNNVAFSRELTRRLVTIKIDAVSENPSSRTGFKHHPLEAWARDNRARLTQACLILCQNWIAKGKRPGSAVFGSYEEYAGTIGGILDSAGVVGFLANRPKRGAGRDRESIRWPALVEAWYEHRQYMATSTGMIYDLIFGEPGIADLRVAFADVVGEKSQISQRQKLGSAIAAQDGRIWAGHRIVRTGDIVRNGCSLYRLASPESKPDDDGDEWPEGRE